MAPARGVRLKTRSSAGCVEAIARNERSQRAQVTRGKQTRHLLLGPDRRERPLWQSDWVLLLEPVGLGVLGAVALLAGVAGVAVVSARRRRPLRACVPDPIEASLHESIA